MNRAILGAGEVANAINYQYECKMYDIGEWENAQPDQVKFLHVCIPYSDQFITIVRRAIIVFQPECVIIHSTVKPSTTRQLGESAVYSPVMGRHADDFKTNILNYKKYVAGVDLITLSKAVEELNCFNSQSFSSNPDELEYAKIMETTSMYWYLLINKVMGDDCKRYGYDFAKVYTMATRNYNKGIVDKHPDWVKPIYDYIENHLPGGHCLRPNIHLVDNFIVDKLKEWEDKVK